MWLDNSFQQQHHQLSQLYRFLTWNAFNIPLLIQSTSFVLNFACFASFCLHIAIQGSLECGFSQSYWSGGKVQKTSGHAIGMTSTYPTVPVLFWEHASFTLEWKFICWYGVASAWKACNNDTIKKTIQLSVSSSLSCRHIVTWNSDIYFIRHLWRIFSIKKLSEAASWPCRTPLVLAGGRHLWRIKVNTQNKKLVEIG